MSDIKIIKVESDDTRNYNKKLYTRAEIIFRDGTIIGSLKNKGKKAYIAADMYLRGTTPGGTFEILLGNVKTIEMKL